MAISLMLIASTCAADGHGGEKKRRGPPAKALAACQNLEAGSSCTFEGRRGEVSGTCYTPSQDKPLACKPTRGKKGKRDRQQENQENDG